MDKIEAIGAAIHQMNVAERNEAWKGKRIRELERQRDELLVALKNLRAECDTGERHADGKQRGVKMPQRWAVDEADAAIAKVEGAPKPEAQTYTFKSVQIGDPEARQVFLNGARVCSDAAPDPKGGE